MPHANLAGQSICIEPGLRAAHRDLAAAGYWHTFSRKLRYPLGPQRKGIAFIRRILDPNHAISAISGTGEFLGVAGFKTPRGAFVDGNLTDLAGIYGWPGAIVRAPLVAALGRDCDDATLLMDGIFVQPEARGLGVGTALLDAVERQAAATELDRVRLDVIDTNPRARSLYERRGYREHATQSVGFLRHVFGFARATTMLKRVG